MNIEGGRDLRVLIVDDEPLARARLRGQLNELGFNAGVDEASSGLAALDVMSDATFDVVLLDIRMPGMDGLETARHLTRLASAPAIIFTTAYNEHALAAFEAHAIDYLLKPIRSERLKSALDRARLMSAAQLREAETQVSPRPRTHFSALVAGRLRIVPVADVRYLQADSGYVTVKHLHGELLIDDSLRVLEQEFSTSMLRIHRNTLVSSAHIAMVERDAAGNGKLSFRDISEQLVVSRRLLPDVWRRLRK
jgi:two-component system response regulator AlgR